MARLPQPGGEKGRWGNILNNYLLQEHNADGSHRLTTVLNVPAQAGHVLMSQPADPKGVQWVTPQQLMQTLADSTQDSNATTTAATSGLSITGDSVFTGRITQDTYLKVNGGDANGMLITATATSVFSGGGLYGLNARASVMNGAPGQTINWVAGGKLNGFVSNSCAATVSTLRGGWMVAEHAGTGTVTSANAVVAQVFRANTGNITNATGVRVSDVGGSGSGGINNQYGVYVEDQIRGATNNYAIYTNYGKVRFGDTVIMNGGVAQRRLPVADASYVITTYDYLVAYTSLSAPRTVTLPTNQQTGKTYVVKDECGQAGIHPITVVAAGATIDGMPSKSIATNFGSLTFYYNGANWFTIT